jgi:pyrimidine operon attenuation protein / uracil phosphoribosyltransferase
LECVKFVNMAKAVKILNATEIDSKLKRMAYEILENNIDEKVLMVCGISGSGFAIAKIIAAKLKEITKIKLIVFEICINKANPTDCYLDVSEKLDSTSIIVVDDVANSGRTLLYALNPFLNIIAKKIQIAVLVDRKHKNYPVSADYIGHTVTTTLQERIDVVIKNGEVEGAYLV